MRALSCLLAALPAAAARWAAAASAAALLLGTRSDKRAHSQPRLRQPPLLLLSAAERVSVCVDTCDTPLPLPASVSGSAHLHVCIASVNELDVTLVVDIAGYSFSEPLGRCTAQRDGPDVDCPLSGTYVMPSAVQRWTGVARFDWSVDLIASPSPLCVKAVGELTTYWVNGQPPTPVPVCDSKACAW